MKNKLAIHKKELSDGFFIWTSEDIFDAMWYDDILMRSQGVASFAGREDAKGVFFCQKTLFDILGLKSDFDLKRLYISDSEFKGSTKLSFVNVLPEWREYDDDESDRPSGIFVVEKDDGYPHGLCLDQFYTVKYLATGNHPLAFNDDEDFVAYVGI